MTCYVYEEHTLLKHIEGSPNFTILAASPLRGSTFDPRLDGHTILLGFNNLRPATKEDFAAFRVDPRGYFPD